MGIENTIAAKREKEKKLGMNVTRNVKNLKRGSIKMFARNNNKKKHLNNVLG